MVAEHAERLATLRLQYALNAGGGGEGRKRVHDKSQFYTTEVRRFHSF
jgi:hypothetical protein